MVLDREKAAHRTVDILDINDGAAIAVASTATVWSHSFVLPKNSSFSFEFQFTSSGTVEADVELEQGTTELTAAEEGLTNANYVIPDGASKIGSAIGDEVIHIKAHNPAVTHFGRLKITGTGANDASTTLSKAQMHTVKNT